MFYFFSDKKFTSSSKLSLSRILNGFWSSLLRLMAADLLVTGKITVFPSQVIFVPFLLEDKCSFTKNITCLHYCVLSVYQTLLDSISRLLTTLQSCYCKHDYSAILYINMIITLCKKCINIFFT